MKLLLTLTLALDCALGLQLPSSVRIRRNADAMIKNGSRIAANAVLATALLTSPAFATTADPTIFNHEYSDPFHPLCKRKIEVNADGASFHYSGTAVGPKDDTVLRGCSPAEIKAFGLRKGAFDGLILEGNVVSAGDGIHEGVWEPAFSTTTTLGYEDKDGIRWNDGNKWVVNEKKMATKVGEVIFYSYIGFSALAGVKGVSDGIKRKQERNA